MTSSRPAIKGIHHVKLAVSDLDVSLDFYERLFGATRIPEADHHREAGGALYAYILDVPGLGSKLELRLNPEQAEKHRRFDPMTIAVQDKAVLESWLTFLDGAGIAHSPILTAIQAWLIVVEDPDQNRLRLYTVETDGRELEPDEDNAWLQD